MEHLSEAAEDVRGRGGRLQKGAPYRHVVVNSPPSFRLHFSAIRMGSRGTFVLCTDTPDVPGSMLSSSWRVSSVHLQRFFSGTAQVMFNY